MRITLLPPPPPGTPVQLVGAHSALFEPVLVEFDRLSEPQTDVSHADPTVAPAGSQTAVYSVAGNQIVGYVVYAPPVPGRPALIHHIAAYASYRSEIFRNLDLNLGHPAYRVGVTISPVIQPNWGMSDMLFYQSLGFVVDPHQFLRMPPNPAATDPVSQAGWLAVVLNLAAGRFAPVRAPVLPPPPNFAP